MAMLVVVLVATVSSAVLWRQWRSVEIQTAQQTQAQALWVLDGALDWARLILSEDGRKGGADALNEPWAVPLKAARLNTFLASDGHGAADDQNLPEAFLSGHITDLQARLNLRNLVENGQLQAASFKAFSRLFAVLGLPQSQLDDLAQALLAADAAAQASPARQASPTAALWPQNLAQLAWLGATAQLVEQLRPFVTILPEPTPVNLNTAPLEVLYACVDGLALAQARQWLAVRQQRPWSSLDEVRANAGGWASRIVVGQHSVSSQHFEINGALQLAQHTFRLQSVVRRESGNVTTLTRQRGLAEQAAL
jgi:general secretion pathway protein K